MERSSETDRGGEGIVKPSLRGEGERGVKRARPKGQTEGRGAGAKQAVRREID